MSKVIVIGGGLAGLMSTIKLAEAGTHVELFSLVPVKRSHSICAQGGINGAVNTKGEGDSTWLHFDDTVYGGDFLANQPPVKGMCDAAPAIIHMMDRMGVMFSRTPEGLLDFRRFGGTKFHRTAFAGATTGQQLLYALDEQVRRYESEGLVQKYEQWEFLSAVIEEGVCKGIVAQNMRDMSIRAFAGDAVIIATGGAGLVFGKSTNSAICTGSASSGELAMATSLNRRRSSSRDAIRMSSSSSMMTQRSNSGPLMPSLPYRDCAEADNQFACQGRGLVWLSFVIAALRRDPASSCGGRQRDLGARPG